MTRMTKRHPRAPARRRLAFHEAGHAVVAHLCRMPLACVSIERQGRFLGRVEAHSPGGRSHGNGNATRPVVSVAVREAIVCLAGAVAEFRVSQRFDWHGSSDDRTSALTALGDATHSLNQTAALMDFAWAVVLDVFRDERCWAAVERVAAGLLEHGTLDGTKLRRVMRLSRRPGGIPRWR